jgi:SAM-dependent methyltransferase
VREGRLGEDGTPHLVADGDLSGPLPVHNALLLTGEVAPEGVESVVVRIGGADHLAALTDGRFSVFVDTSGWTRGEYPFTLEARGRDGSTADLEGVAEVEPYGPPPADEAAVLETVGAGGAAMWCEAPALDGSVVADGELELRGWAIAPAGIARVLVTVDGSRRLRALYGLPRSDLRRAFGDELAADCGFALRLDPEELPPGRHELAVVAVAADGSALGMTGAVEVESATAPRLPGSREGIDASPSRHLRPPPAPAAFGAGFGGDRVAAAYARYGAYAMLAALGFSGSALDVGCQAGWGTALLARSIDEVVGVDPSPLALADAERAWGGAARFQPGDFAELPFPDGSFDLVVCLGVLAQAAEPELALGEMRRVLRPGGTLALSPGVGAGGAPFHTGPSDSESLQAWLAERFSAVEARALRLDLAATLDGHGGAAPAVTVGAPESTRAAATDAGGWLLLASDAALPQVPGTVLLDAGAVEDERRHLTELWRERSVLAEVRMATLRTEAHYLSAANRKTLERAAAQVAGAEAEVAAARAAAQRLEAANAAMRNSLSWRLTGPLRAAKSLVRRLRRGRALSGDAGGNRPGDR